MKLSLKFLTNSLVFNNDYMDIIRAFGSKIQLSDDGEVLLLNNYINTNSNNLNINVEIISSLLKDSIKASFVIDNINQYYQNDISKNLDINSMDDLDNIKLKSLVKRYTKVELYKALCIITNMTLPYGSLTGIRPTKLYKEILQDNGDAYDYFRNKLLVSQEKTNLIKDIVNNQIKIYNKDDKQVDIFVNIPICTTRCSYCSFISAEYSKVKKLVPQYVDILIAELAHAKQLIKEYNLVVRSVYIGGGTPTSIDDESLERIISNCDFDCREFTVEAGRVDTITRSKLDIMSKYNVGRISVNPQTFNQKTLDIIGRKHTIDDFYQVYKMVREYSFDVNMDLIAMLPNESYDDFTYSVDSAILLSPENITVHTLAMKRGSVLNECGYDNNIMDTPTKMVDYSYQALQKYGYEPYYMYKQKYMSGNLENVGYCKSGKECIYNVDIMEETTTIIACGAGGISKYIDHSQNRLERHANPKGLDVYLSRNQDNISTKDKFFRDNYSK